MTVSMKKCSSSGGAYYVNCMTVTAVESGTAIDDYYTGAGIKGKGGDALEPPGVWYAGKNADGTRTSRIGIRDNEAFGTEDSYDTERFEHINKGWHPDNGTAMVQNAGKEGRIAFYDFCASAPKSISIAWAMADQDLKVKIEKAQFNASRTFLDYLSTKSQTACKRPDGSFGLVDAPLRAAMFSHASTRGGKLGPDPQIHTHCVVFNLIETGDKNGLDGHTSVLEKRNMMRWQGAAASLYHADLAWRMRELEFGVEKKGNLFEASGVSDEVMAHFSQRRAQIVEAVDKYMQENGLNKASRGLFQKATIETRQDKDKSLTREKLEALWHERGAALGFTAREVKALMSEGPAPVLTKEQLLVEARAVVREITETESVFKEPQLLTKLAVHLVGRASPEQILSTLTEIKKELYACEQAVVGADKRSDIEETTQFFTTHEMILLEREMLEMANRPDAAHVLQDLDALSGLKDEQLEAALAACTSTNSVSVVEGTAGAGKTYTMRAIAAQYAAEGYTAIGLASGWAATLNLKKEAGLDEAKAITGWVNGYYKGDVQVNHKTLLIVDEAGMVGSRQMHQVLQIARETGAKVVLLGDTKQQSSVSSGDPLRVITAEIGSNRLDVIRRQKQAADRAAVKLFFDGKAADGLTPYLSRGAVKVALNEAETHQAMIKDWHASFSKKVGDSINFHRKGLDLTGKIEKVNDENYTVRMPNGSKQEVGNTHLMIAVDGASVRELNRLAHEARKAAGELGEGRLFHTMDCKNPGDMVEFAPGDLVVCRTNNKELDFYNRNRGVIESIRGDIIYVRTEDQRVIEINPHEKNAHGEGKWEHHEGGFGLQHAYATTVYASQGLTVDRVYVKDSLSLSSRESAGVAMSRHRESAQLYVDKGARYEAKMNQIPSDEWHHIKAFSDEECLSRLTKSWSSERVKNCTLDFERWEFQGLAVNVEAEVQISKIDSARLAAAAEITRIQQSSKSPIRHIIPRAEHEFQKTQHYVLPDESSPQVLQNKEIQKYQAAKIPPHILKAAVASGFIQFDQQSGKLITCGRRPGDGALVNKTDASSGAERNDSVLVLRDRYPPILAGDPGNTRVDIVKTGDDALALHSMQDRKGMQKSTVIVTNNSAQSLTLPHVRDLIDNAAAKNRLHIHDKKTVENGVIAASNASIFDVNKGALPAEKTAEKAAQQAAEKAAQLAAQEQEEKAKVL